MNTTTIDLDEKSYGLLLGRTLRTWFVRMKNASASLERRSWKS